MHLLVLSPYCQSSYCCTVIMINVSDSNKMIICWLITLQEDWDFLQLQCALYINSEMSGIPLSMQVSCK